MFQMMAAVPLVAQQNLIQALRPILRVVEAASPVSILQRPQQHHQARVYTFDDLK
jgi:hypothetical protein